MTTARRVLFLLTALFLYFYGSQARAATFSDLWWNPNESGWGANLIQQQDVIFITLFVYGPDGRPTWYVGPATTAVSGASRPTYSGGLYATTGPWFGSGFNPNAVGVRQVGNVTFVASSQVAGTLTYSVDGVPVVKAIQRETWRHITLGGTYYGAVDVLDGNACGLTGALIQPFYAVQTLTATVTSSGTSGSLTFSIRDTGGGVATFTGTYVQYGSLFDVTGTFALPGTAPLTAAIRDFTADDDGIRGNLLALVGTCTINFRFAAVRPG
jgi:hypothetical protein